MKTAGFQKNKTGRLLHPYTAVGAAWVALDASWPRGRLRAAVVDAGLSALVTFAPSSAWEPRELLGTDADLPTVRMGHITGDERPPPAFAFADMSKDDRSEEDTRVCYVLYTSGSTGKPKVTSTFSGLF